jgi:hypothetical protein
VVGQEDAHARSVRRKRLAGAGTLLLAAVPWLWFVVRDALGVVADVIAIGIPVLVVASVLASLRRRRTWVVGVSALLAGVVAVVGPWIPAERGVVAGTGVSVAGANADSQVSPVSALRDLQADVLVVAELNADLPPQLPDSYLHRVTSTDDGLPVGVFSRYPLRLLEGVGPELPGMRVRIEGPDGPFVLYALHIPRPWFPRLGGGYHTTVAGHYAFTEQVARQVRQETLPTVVVGDLNSTDRGRDYRDLLREGGLADVMRDIWGGPTSVGKWLPLLGRIDHILVSEGWCGDGAQRADLPGSSHRAVVATVGPCVGSAP